MGMTEGPGGHDARGNPESVFLQMEGKVKILDSR